MYTQYFITIATFGCGHCETGVKPKYVSFLKSFYYSTTWCIHKRKKTYTFLHLISLKDFFNFLLKLSLYFPFFPPGGV